ncbi:hypothetical protein Y1Q_0019211 [Alligator mississippiensis]|uniref:Uncharacterized protein n=1 Tax=Alligator mississippiensis TaxID=8496 RepID=A0A151MQD5_ALLMI|nr:hypothetical protein Y1Q_0019211 [Alligator mississippiensis]
MGRRQRAARLGKAAAGIRELKKNREEEPGFCELTLQLLKYGDNSTVDQIMSVIVNSVINRRREDII